MAGWRLPASASRTPCRFIITPGCLYTHQHLPRDPRCCVVYSLGDRLGSTRSGTKKLTRHDVLTSRRLTHDVTGAREQCDVMQKQALPLQESNTIPPPPQRRNVCVRDSTPCPSPPRYCDACQPKPLFSLGDGDPCAVAKTYARENFLGAETTRYCHLVHHVRAASKRAIRRRRNETKLNASTSLRV